MIPPFEARRQPHLEPGQRYTAFTRFINKVIVLCLMNLHYC
jgi:hypothetical protein